MNRVMKPNHKTPQEIYHDFCSSDTTKWRSSRQSEWQCPSKYHEDHR